MCDHQRRKDLALVVHDLKVICFVLLLVGVDLNVSSSAELFFLPGSVEGDIQCITINLLADVLLEVPENFVVELYTTDPAVTIPEASDIAIITINNVLDPRGNKLFR